jgi:hypothetical protein
VISIGKGWEKFNDNQWHELIEYIRTNICKHKWIDSSINNLMFNEETQQFELYWCHKRYCENCMLRQIKISNKWIKETDDLIINTPWDKLWRKQNNK